jgi:hypothetical protein
MLVLNGALQNRIVQQRKVIMTETVIAFPRSKERLTNLLRNILGDVVAISTAIDEIFDEYSPEHFDEVRRRLELIQAEVESLKDFSSREAVGWITG